MGLGIILKVLFTHKGDGAVASAHFLTFFFRFPLFDEMVLLVLCEKSHDGNGNKHESAG